MELKAELKAQFMPTDTIRVAHDALHRIRHTRTIRDYVEAYADAMLDIPRMDEDDRLYFFLERMQTWAQLEVRR